MSKKENNILLIILISFSVYCALTVGETWDQKDNILRGKITLEYLFSLGRVDENIFARHYYSPMYWSLLYFFAELFPKNYEIQVINLVNLFFSLCLIFGVKQLCKELFNDKVAKIVFIILFFYPIFFGHISFNTKDTILAFGHIWITCLIIRYLKKQSIESKRKKYIFYLGLLGALCTGIQLLFFATLVPFFLFLIAEVFVFKKIVDSKFNNRKFFFDIIKSFIFFYLILILFWIDTHPNIFILPYQFISEIFSETFWTGWYYNLLNGNYFISYDAPKTYFLAYIIYKSPEYFLLSYLFFIFFYLISNKFFKKEFTFFNYKLLFIIGLLLYPSIVLHISPFPIYDGIRLFYWSIPYFCIIPGLIIYYFLKNFNYLSSKICLSIMFILSILLLYNFVTITPYHYAYSNILAGKNENRFNKFENDYWGSSIRELIKNSKFNESEIIRISTCGINPKIAKRYFIKKGYSNIELVHPDESKYVIMTNRTVLDDKTGKISNCFNVFKGDTIFEVTRNKLLLSTIRKIN